MRVERNHMKLRVLVSFLFVGLLMAVPADAYVDPGTAGLLTQLIYVLFYGLLGVFLVCIRYIKQIFMKPKKFLLKFLWRS